MEPFNFNELPEVVRRLFEKVERIEAILDRFEPQDDDADELMNVEQAAAFLKVSVAALYTRVSRKEIAVSKPGKRLYFKKADLNDWVDQGRRKTITDIAGQADQFFRNRRRVSRQ